jgi:hypothetical protein
MVDIFGAIVDTNHPAMVGLIFQDRVLWVNVQTSLLVEPQTSKAIIEAHIRKMNRLGAIFDDPRVSLIPDHTKKEPTTNIFEAPEMSFIGDEEPVAEPPTIDDGPPTTFPKFDMGRAAEKPEKKKKVLGEEESETLELPGWLNGVRGLATKHIPNDDEEV